MGSSEQPIFDMMRTHGKYWTISVQFMFSFCNFDGDSHPLIYTWYTWSASWQCKKIGWHWKSCWAVFVTGCHSCHSCYSWMFVLPNMTIIGLDWSPSSNHHGITGNSGMTTKAMKQLEIASGGKSNIASWKFPELRFSHVSSLGKSRNKMLDLPIIHHL